LSKFIFGDIGKHVSAAKVDLNDYTVVGVGCLDLLRSWGLRFSQDPLEQQHEGLAAVRELQSIINGLMDVHPGLQIACRCANLNVLTSYDIQVQCCECKRGFNLPPRIKSARASLRIV
jgi:hypothetical protein